jgi:hypothetical protein
MIATWKSQKGGERWRFRNRRKANIGGISSPGTANRSGRARNRPTSGWPNRWKPRIEPCPPKARWECARRNRYRRSRISRKLISRRSCALHSLRRRKPRNTMDTASRASTHSRNSPQHFWTRSRPKRRSSRRVPERCRRSNQQRQPRTAGPGENVPHGALDPKEAAHQRRLGRRPLFFASKPGAKTRNPRALSCTRSGTHA